MKWIRCHVRCRPWRDGPYRVIPHEEVDAEKILADMRKNLDPRGPIPMEVVWAAVYRPKGRGEVVLGIRKTSRAARRLCERHARERRKQPNTSP